MECVHMCTCVCICSIVYVLLIFKFYSFCWVMPFMFTDGMTTIKILSGECLGTSAAIETRIPILFFDIHVAKGGKFDVAIPSNYNSFVYTWKGSGCVGTERTLVNDGKVSVIVVFHSFFSKFQHVFFPLLSVISDMPLSGMFWNSGTAHSMWSYSGTELIII